MSKAIRTAFDVGPGALAMPLFAQIQKSSQKEPSWIWESIKSVATDPLLVGGFLLLLVLGGVLIYMRRKQDDD